MDKRFNWKLFSIVWILATLGAIAVIPYQLSLQSSAVENFELPLPLPALIAISAIQSAIFMAVLTASGLFLAKRVSLGLPFLESWLNGAPRWHNLPAALRLALSGGTFAGLAIIGLEKAIFEPGLRAIATPLPDISQPPIWQGFLASFYGGITEEVMLRLFLMTLLVWIGNWLARRQDKPPTLTVLWLANILAALLFGLGHLPATAAAGLPLNGLVITRALTLNGLAGLVFGWLYWSIGLEGAMVAHFFTDLLLHVLFPLLAA